jgi:hypothetical protein
MSHIGISMRESALGKAFHLCGRYASCELEPVWVLIPSDSLLATRLAVSLAIWFEDRSSINATKVED